MIYLQNVKRVQEQIDRWFTQRVQEAVGAAKGLAISALLDILKNSPQSTGDFVVNWNVSLNTPDPTVWTQVGPQEPGGWRARREVYKQGDQPAQQEALARNADALSKFKLGDTIYLTNASVHDEAYAVKIEDGAINFRDVNRNADRPVGRALDRIGHQWGGIMSWRSAKKLSQKKL